MTVKLTALKLLNFPITLPLMPLIPTDDDGYPVSGDITALQIVKQVDYLEVCD